MTTILITIAALIGILAFLLVAACATCIPSREELDEANEVERED
jgi:hypothetical protein